MSSTGCPAGRHCGDIAGYRYASLLGKREYLCGACRTARREHIRWIGSGRSGRDRSLLPSVAKYSLPPLPEGIRGPFERAVSGHRQAGGEATWQEVESRVVMEAGLVPRDQGREMRLLRAHIDRLRVMALRAAYQ